MVENSISPEDFLKFREYFYRKTGIQFEDSKRYFVDKRIAERMEVTHSSTFREYFTLLRFQVSGVEFQELTNLLTVNETYFFREEYQLQCLVRSILPEVTRRKRPGTPIRIWSVPSSSGEEPYSIAIYLSEYWSEIEKWDIELHSSDIDTRILKKAEDALYVQRQVQYVPADILSRYFTRTVTGSYKLSDDIRGAVTFSRVNLVDPAETKSFRNFDIVFCRNLLIYFDDVSRRKAADIIYEALNPGGFVCLGHSESMSRISPLFQVRSFPEAIVYQKPERP